MLYRSFQMTVGWCFKSFQMAIQQMSQPHISYHTLCIDAQWQQLQCQELGLTLMKCWSWLLRMVSIIVNMSVISSFLTISLHMMCTIPKYTSNSRKLRLLQHVYMFLVRRLWHSRSPNLSILYDACVMHWEYPYLSMQCTTPHTQ